MRRPDLLLALAALAAGVLFFFSVPFLWPLPDADLVADRSEVEAQARAALASRGFDVTEWQTATSVGIDRRVLDYVQRELGVERAQALVRAGFPVVDYDVRFKKRNETTSYVVSLHPGGGVVRFSRVVEDEFPGASLSAEQAEVLAREALTGIGLDMADWSPRSTTEVDRPHRRDHGFTFERVLIAELGVRERATVRVAGDVVDRAQRSVSVPARARKEAKARAGPGKVLENIGFLLGAVCALAAFWVFLTKLGEGRVRLRRAFALALAIFVGLVVVALLHSTRTFQAWDPLFAPAVSLLDFLVERVTKDLWMTIVLLGVIGAADALDRDLPEAQQRGRTLWSFLSGRFTDPGVAAASGRGFGIGLLCGGMLAISFWAISLTVGTEVALQPRGVFLDVLNSSAAPLTALILFLNAALIEELGYRWFGATWLHGLTGKRWLAILIPALVFGLTHTRMFFLPPAEPFWGRAFVMTMVGLVWGWALFRYDALTVVLSHWVADLVLFNTPRLFSGKADVIAVTLLTISVPLLPALLGLARRAMGFGFAPPAAPMATGSPPPPG